jgi:DNA polymerase I
MPSQRTLYLVDASGQLHRAYHAIRGLTNHSGLPTNAVFGFTSMLRRLYQEEDPQWMAMVFDLPGPTFRHQEYAEYKAHRPKMEEDLAVQIPYVRRVCDVFRLPAAEAPGFEADDVIATLARQAVAAGLHVVIVSNDKDLLQLVCDDVTVLSPGREGALATRFDAKAVEDKLGVPPGRVVDLLALVGDASDNVPGVAGIGEKGARDLVREFGTLEDVLQHADQVKRNAYREGLKNHRDDALLSKRLVTLRSDAPVTLDLEALRRQPADRSAAHALFVELAFASLAKEFAPEIAPVVSEVAPVASPAELSALLTAARERGRLAVAVAMAERDGRVPQTLGVAVAVDEGRSAYLPMHGAGVTLSEPEVLAAFASVASDAQIAKLCFASKRDIRALGDLGIRLQGVTFDATLAAYLIEPGRRQYAAPDVALAFLGERLDPAATASPSRSAGLEADLALRLAPRLMGRLEQEGLAPIYRDLELPLAAVLAEMESVGVALDSELLARIGAEMEQRLAVLTAQIHTLAGGEFNINSPAQLRDVLFGKLGLKSGKKTAKTRAASTAEEVLEELSAEHELPRRILEYRSVQKLKSTYVDALPQLVRPGTGRIHATFHQTIAATGRLSSSDPNLQNIPIRSSEGRRIREAFIAPPGHLLLSADYSQIELRILAHLSQDPALIDTFRRGEDVHDRTALEVFGPFSPIAREQQRSFSKMINYALLYGKTAFTLAKDLGVSRREAEAFITTYFARYPRVRTFVDETIAGARATGVVRTLLGRLRRLPEINSKNTPVRLEAERQAVNTPVQGSAADLIKRAMLDLHRELSRGQLRARLVLQIHDELLLEVPETEGARVLELVHRVMEGALALDVPLVVDARLGRNWAEAH